MLENQVKYMYTCTYKALFLRKKIAEPLALNWVESKSLNVANIKVKAKDGRSGRACPLLHVHVWPEFPIEHLFEGEIIT